MKRHTWKAFVLVTGLFVAVSAQPAVARAGLIADTWNAIFGPPGTPYFPGAYSSYYVPSYSTAYYAPTYSAGYGNSCCRPATVYYPPPCCPTVCDPCVVGNCAVPATGNGSKPQTFKKPGTMNDDPPMPDSKFQPRDDSKKFQPTDKNKKSAGKNSEFPTPAGDGDGDNGTGKNGTQRKAFRVPGSDPDNDAPAPLIRQKKPVSPKSPAEKSDKSDQKQLPSLTLPKFDEKITWKPAVRRTRLIINSRVRHPQLSRTIVDPNAGWKPVRNDSRVVRK